MSLSLNADNGGSAKKKKKLHQGQELLAYATGLTYFLHPFYTSAYLLIATYKHHLTAGNLKKTRNLEQMVQAKHLRPITFYSFDNAQLRSMEYII